MKMEVVKRNGQTEEVSFDKIKLRINKMANLEPKLLNVDSIEIAQKVIARIYDKISTVELDEETASICTSLITKHPDYSILGSRIIISNSQKNTNKTFQEKLELLVQHNIMTQEILEVYNTHKTRIDETIDYERDFNFDYFGYKTLEKSYLQKIDGVTIERIQDLLMRVSLGIHKNDIDNVLKTYDLMSSKYFIHASPTLYNAGTPRPQLLSCFLIGIDDSINGIYKCLGDCAAISKWAGGIGLHVSNIRGNNSYINGTNGKTSGIVPMLRVFNSTARYVNQGGRRLGSFAIYLEPHHSDIMEFLELKKNHGLEEERARDLFYALWISDLFMERVKSNKLWSLFSPDTCPDLEKVWGNEYKELYEKYEAEGKAVKQIPAQQIWFKICTSQIETGTPYILYKDSANRKSNQQNYGTIKSSNLCVAPDTKILTDQGHIEIQKLHKKNVNVWNGKKFSNVKICKTGENQELLKVSLSDSSSVECTPYHKFYIQKGYISNYNGDIINHKNVKTIDAQDLRTGMKIIKCDYPVINTKKELQHAYTNGIFSGDGTYTNCGAEEQPCKFKSLEGKSYCKRHINYQNENDTNDNEICKGVSYSKKPHITLYGEKIDLLQYLDYESCGEVKDNKLNVKLNVNLEEKFFVPVNYSIQSKMDWFSGYADADGCITTNEGNQSLQISSIEKKFLMDVKLMLQTCGINTKISLMRGTSQSYLPDGRGDYKYFDTKPLWRIIIASNELQQLLDLGFNPKRLKVEKNNNIQRSATKFITIENVEKLDKKSDTYCFNEPLRHAGIFNGVILSQCTEILEYSDDKEYACCTLSSICLPSFLKADKTFDFVKLYEVAQIVTNNLNKVIDINYYPVPETELSNKRHRPLGIGVQGLADVFINMEIPFDSPEAAQLNKEIFAVIYYAGLHKSLELSKIHGSYETFKGSPLSEGKFQFDLWGTEPITSVNGLELNWQSLKEEIITHGVRNSLLLAPMPTASTSQIMGYNECFEPYTSFLYTRSTLAGQFEVVNHKLLRDLIELGLWNKEMKNKMLLDDGSIQNIPEIPDRIKAIYKNSWDLSNKTLIDMSADRGAYVCQSQSLNLSIAEPTFKSLSSMHFYSWKKGLKTGIYYLRTKPKTTAQKFTVEPEKKAPQENSLPCDSCSG